MTKKRRYKTPVESMTMTELALLYAADLTPHSAVNRLMKWISKIPKLVRALNEAGYRKHSKRFSPEQVALIFRYLGEP